MRLLLAGLLVFATSAIAATPEVADDEVADAVGDPPPKPGEPNSLTLERLATLSPAQKVQYTVEALEEMKSMQRQMERMQQSAPECVETRLLLLNALVEVSEMVQATMFKHQNAGDMARADLELRKMAVALSTARGFLAEALGCASTDATQGSGLTSVEYEGLVEWEDTSDDPPFDFDVSSPPPISPFQ